jgi:hypothetical protein
MKHFVSAALAAFGIGLAALPAAGADTTCTTTLSNGTINGNLVVPNGNNCSLTNETVTGNVTVGTGASLTVDAATIGGSIGANHCSFVQLFNDLGPVSVRGSVVIESCFGSRIGANGYNNLTALHSFTISGNFTCSNNSAPFGAAGCIALGGSVGGNLQANNNTGVEGADVGANTVMGNVQVNANAGGDEVTGNTVMGNVQVNNNTDGAVGGSVVGGNKIGGNLACQGNTRVINGGVPNTVAGNERGQCAGL